MIRQLGMLFADSKLSGVAGNRCLISIFCISVTSCRTRCPLRLYLYISVYALHYILVLI